MESFALLLVMLSMLGGIFFIVALIIRKIRKKPKNKVYSRGLLISILAFVLGIVLFAVFETPESKARYEQQRIEEQKAKAKEEQAKKEKAEREKAEKEQAKKEQAEKEKAEKEQLKKEQAEKEKAKKEQAKKEKAEREKAEKERAKKEKAEREKAKKEQAEQKEANKEKNIKKAIINVVGKENFDTFNYVPENHFALIKFKGKENLTAKQSVRGMYFDIYNILKDIQKDIDVNVDFNVTYPLQDTYGNVTDDIVIKATFKKKTIKKINFMNVSYKNIPLIADEWWNHNALNIAN